MLVNSAIVAVKSIYLVLLGHWDGIVGVIGYWC